MDVSVVVDASVWASGFIDRDVNSNTSRLWLQRYITEGGIIVAPTFLLIEVAAAVSRQAGQPIAGLSAVKYVFNVQGMQLQSPNPQFFWEAVEIAAGLPLRAGDAIYVALARQFNIPLVSWDKEQLQRARRLIATYTPNDYPFSSS
jgi:predicted nucleic acid-binding protein